MLFLPSPQLLESVEERTVTDGFALCCFFFFFAFRLFLKFFDYFCV